MREATPARLLLAAAVALTAALGGTARAADAALTGAGSTFVAPLVSKWIDEWSRSSGVRVTYDAVGSGKGVDAVTARQVDFGASDAPLTSDQFRRCGGCVQIPWALSATAVAYNLPGYPNNLHVSGPVLAAIYLGKITRWKDPALQALNPKIKLPDRAIVPVYRSDASGTSFNFTDFLSKASPEWRSRIGRSTQPAFPVGKGAEKSSGVAGLVAETPGALCYVDVAYTLSNQLFFMSVRNRAGRFALPGLRGLNAAARAFRGIAPDNSLSIVDPPASAPTAYPICTYTYAIVPLRSGQATELKRFISYAVGPGQKQGPRLYFAPLPAHVLAAAIRATARIQPAR